MRDQQVPMSRPCPARRPRLHRCVDAELSEQDTQELQKHLNACPGCKEFYGWLELENNLLSQPDGGPLSAFWMGLMDDKVTAQVQDEMAIAFHQWQQAVRAEPRQQQQLARRRFQRSCITLSRWRPDLRRPLCELIRQPTAEINRRLAGMRQALN